MALGTPLQSGCRRRELRTEEAALPIPTQTVADEWRSQRRPAAIATCKSKAERTGSVLLPRLSPMDRRCTPGRISRTPQLVQVGHDAQPSNRRAGTVLRRCPGFCECGPAPSQIPLPEPFSRRRGTSSLHRAKAPTARKPAGKDPKHADLPEIPHLCAHPWPRRLLVERLHGFPVRRRRGRRRRGSGRRGHGGSGRGPVPVRQRRQRSHQRRDVLRASERRAAFATPGCALRGWFATNNTCCDATTAIVRRLRATRGTVARATAAAPAVPVDRRRRDVHTRPVRVPSIADCGYPYASDNPLTSVEFIESEVLRAIDPSGGAPLASIRLFYNDEHALTLGVSHVDVTDSAGTTGKDYPVTPLTTDPSATAYPETGTNEVSGDYSGLDQSGRPMWPVLYVTDTTNDPNDRSGDWQQCGTPYNPNAVFGSWKAALRTVDKTLNPADVSIAPDADPTKNDWDLAGGDPVPTGLTSQGFGAEVRWNLVLIPGRSYRIQVLVHDGDQNKAGGDSGEACVNFCASASCPTGSTACQDGQ